MKDTKSTVVYTDGACSGNPGPGGWAAIIVDDTGMRELSGGSPATTNNRMELTAVIEALKAVDKDCAIDLYADSQYVVNAINQHWMKAWKRDGWTRKGDELKNAEMWQELDRLLKGRTVDFHWVKGHAGDPMNERADKLATSRCNEAAKGAGVSSNTKCERSQKRVIASFPDAVVLPALQEILEASASAEAGTKQPCGAYPWCADCEADEKSQPCAYAFLAHRQQAAIQR